jgi:hypothetical protein
MHGFSWKFMLETLLEICRRKPNQIWLYPGRFEEDCFSEEWSSIIGKGFAFYALEQSRKTGVCGLLRTEERNGESYVQVSYRQYFQVAWELSLIDSGWQSYLGRNSWHTFLHGITSDRCFVCLYYYNYLKSTDLLVRPSVYFFTPYDTSTV